MGAIGRVIALGLVASVGVGGWWFWSSNVAVGGPTSEGEFDPWGPQVVAWRPDERVMDAYRAGLSSEAVGEHREAVPYFAEAVVLDPDFAEARYHLGLASARCGDYDAARAEHVALQDLNSSLATMLAEHLP